MIQAAVSNPDIGKRGMNGLFVSNIGNVVYVSVELPIDRLPTTSGDGVPQPYVVLDQCPPQSFPGARNESHRHRRLIHHDATAA